MIDLQGVRKSFDEGASWAVDGVELSVAEGELVALLGESGCGKTTTLKTINRLVEPTEGRIEVEGRDNREPDPHELRRRIGYVFQGIGLFPHMTVGANVAVVPRLLGWDEAETRARVDELLELVNMPPDTYRDRSSRELSGGQAQRVGLARALAARPRIMLMDEPFGALDPLTRDELQGEYRRIHDELGLTTVMVTHDMTEALLMADRIAVMAAGHIRRVGTPHELLTDPRDETVQKLLEMPRKQARRVDELLEEAG
jgi:osmoprotectant transport system ATP-binding protein